ncbi:DUF805 domain-containing protein [Rhodovarius lipocyclicus]|jgi:uncharacterized membrane protein YhaH (DUF805 family)|uniref:DUF805 domain-containing protein n=1 Tax=Rhodovarius lipocyclicus TaxID=268410 RepID=UPI001359F468|nr:DUF805 domain-containing protein [Rhodovarius lipocyclicus]
MDFGTAIKTCLNKYVSFAGRARRAEYWYFMLFNLILTAVAGVLDQMVGMELSPFSTIVSLVLFLPMLAVSVRRLHDLDKSGWWLLAPMLGLVVMIPAYTSLEAAIVLLWLGGLIAFGTGVLLLVWFLSRGTMGANRFGADPLAVIGQPS